LSTSFLGHISKTVEDIATKLATYIKQVALMFHFIFSVENYISVVVEKVRIYGNEDI